MRLMEKRDTKDEADAVSLCSLLVGGRHFGVDTRKVREVLGRRALQRVPLAPAYIGGVVPYRGEVLTAVSLRALLKMPATAEQSCLLVLDDEGEGERFGLMVDSVGGVVVAEQGAFSRNPSTLDDASRGLFAGAFQLSDGLMVQLDPEKLKPARLAESGLFAALAGTAGEGYVCVR